MCVFCCHRIEMSRMRIAESHTCVAKWGCRVSMEIQCDDDSFYSARYHYVACLPDEDADPRSL